MEGQQAVLPEATQIRRAAANGRNATGPSRLATKSSIGLGLVAFPGPESGLRSHNSDKPGGIRFTLSQLGQARRNQVSALTLGQSRRGM